MCQNRAGRPRSSVSKDRADGHRRQADQEGQPRGFPVAAGAEQPEDRSERVRPARDAPKKKYQTMYHSHCGGATKCWGMALLLAAALAEREDGATTPSTAVTSAPR
jgi:hypothetical protein